MGVTDVPTEVIPENMKRFTLDQADLKKWLTNALTFSAPAILIFLLAIQSGSSLQDAAVAIKLWLLNVLIDITKKFISGHPQN